jgi:hypothetical protein
MVIHARTDRGGPSPDPYRVISLTHSITVKTKQALSLSYIYLPIWKMKKPNETQSAGLALHPCSKINNETACSLFKRDES